MVLNQTQNIKFNLHRT